MKIIIAGAGEVGTHLAKLLSTEDQDVILLDSDQQRLDIIDANYNLMTWNGSTSSFETLRSVGIADADLYIAVTPYETRNLTSCAIAKKLGAKKTVARVDSSEYLRPENGKILKEIGADNLIYPENLAAIEINTALEHSWARYWGELHDGKLLLIGVKLHDKNQIVNLKIKDLPVQAHNFHIVAIKRKNETIIPKGDDMVREDDIVYFVTTAPYVDEVRELCGKKNHTIRKVMIMGGSEIGIRFAKLFHDRYSIKVIDLDRERCEFMATYLPNCEIVHGDARDIEVLRENNVYQCDAFLALTSSAETNILACMTAKEFGIVKTVAEVENMQFLSLAENLNIGTTINKKLLASGRIFKLLLDTDTSSAKFLTLGDAEVAEIKARPNSKITRHMVRDLKLPFGMTLAGLMRDGHCTLVDGNTQILPGDQVVVFCLTGTINKIEKWFM